MGRKLKQICTHEYTNSLIVNKAKKIDNDLILKNAVIVSSCIKCQHEISEYCVGGIVWANENILR